MKNQNNNYQSVKKNNIIANTIAPVKDAPIANSTTKENKEYGTPMISLVI